MSHLKAQKKSRTDNWPSRVPIRGRQLTDWVSQFTFPSTQLVDQIASTILAKLREQEHLYGVEMFRLIINPFSYKQSLENLIAFSELLQRKKIRIETRLIRLWYVRIPQKGERLPHPPRMPLLLDVHEWRIEIERLGITDSLIPNRGS